MTAIKTHLIAKQAGTDANGNQIGCHGVPLIKRECYLNSIAELSRFPREINANVSASAPRLTGEIIAERATATQRESVR
ncbi:hypothetical protein, partial [Dickeya solani]|uniref:hypothetical protein n=1 Tax=Dickeya solani TaxID=1089444 RepID=UPI001C2D04EE